MENTYPARIVAWELQDMSFRISADCLKNELNQKEENEMEMLSSAQQKLDFMKLLVTELQNQNPLEPMDNQQMAAQLAQFTQLELSEQMNGNLESMNQTMENMNTSFQGAMIMAQLDYARSLLGNEISFYSSEHQQMLQGGVQRIQFLDNEPVLEVHATVTNPDTSTSEENMLVRLEEIQGINL